MDAFLCSARRPYAFVGLVLVWNVLLLFGFASQLSLTTGICFLSLPSWPCVRSSPCHVVDVLLVVAAGALLVNRPLPLRLLAYGTFLVQFPRDALQLFTHYLTASTS